MVSRDLNDDDQEAAKDNPGGVGALLMASRLRLGDDLRYVAENLHIRFIYLQAIEDSRYDDLPGAAYAIGFIRTYADYLGLDSDEVVRRYKAESAGGTGETKLVFPVPIPESSIPGGAVIFVGVVVALLSYGLWYVSTAKDGFLAGLVSPVPERISEQKQPEEPEMKAEPVIVAAPAPAPAPAPDVIVEKEVTEPVEQAAPQHVEQAVEQTAAETAPQATPEVAEVTAEVTAEVGEAQQTDAAEVVEKVEQAEKIEKVEEVVAAEPEVRASLPVSEPAPAPAEEPSDDGQVAAVPAASEPVAEEPTAAPATTPATPAVVVQALAEEQQPADEPEPAAATETASTGATSEASSDTASAPTSRQVYGAENEKSRILVRARKNSWIQVRDNNANRLLMTRLLRAGDSYRVPDQEGLVLLTGNAGALEILVDGETVPDLGEAGKVRRNVTLDPDLLRLGTAAN